MTLGASGSELAVILAGAGEGRRMEGRGPKLLLELAGSTLLVRVAATFLSHPAVGELIAVVPERLTREARTILDALPNPRAARVHVIAGGATRQESVRAGLDALERPLAYVAIHDVARALVSEALISRVLDAARNTGAAIPAVPLRDTVKEVDGARIVRTVPRDRLLGAQTPQIFARDIIVGAHARAVRAGSGATDDAWLVEAAGLPVAVVAGDPSNLKLTDPSDLIALESHLRVPGGS